MSKLETVKNSTSGVLNNLGKMLSLAWDTDKYLVMGYYGTAGLAAFFPIITSYTYKLLIDYLVKAQGIETTIPFVIIAIMGSRYILNLTWDFVMWGLKNTFFDFLFRYKIQNRLNYDFSRKVSSLDIAHLENTKTQDLIAKAKDTFTWRCPDFLRQFSYLFNNFVAYVSSFLILIPYGFVIPFAITLATLPRLLLRTKYGKLQWSIYGSGAPETRKLWYFGWLLTQKSSILELRIFQSQKVLLERYRKIQSYLYDINKKPIIQFISAAFFPQIFEVAVVAAFAFWKLPMVLKGTMSIGDFTFFVGMIDRVTESAANMVLNFGDMYENNLYVDHYFEVLALPKLIKEKANATAILALPSPPKVEFKNVSFKYPGSKTYVLKNVSFTIDPAENIAIVGPNGAGKTTIVKLLCRFYDTTAGKILVNGVDLRDVKLVDWYKHLGTLFQEFMHYDLTVSENITLGKSGRKDKELIRLAAEKSGADEFIKKLPKKYNQVLGREFEGGVEISQGQWQKLAIARAFYESAPILILDEPTSAIDAEAEYQIFKNLQNLYRDKTLFFISHRFSTVKNAGKIIVLNEGEIVEQGTHRELMANKREYEKMFTLQAEAYQENG
jgi:ATP-binding cassette, subfamily B, bacterial